MPGVGGMALDAGVGEASRPDKCSCSKPTQGLEANWDPGWGAMAAHGARSELQACPSGPERQ